MEGTADALNDLEKSMNPKLSLKFKIVIIILSVAIAGLLVGVIVLGVKKQEEKIVTQEIIKEKDEENPTQQIIYYLMNKAGYIESWNELYGENITDISYVKNNKIENSFKIGGANYKADMGEINDGNGL